MTEAATKRITVKRARALLTKAKRPFSGNLIAPKGECGEGECEYCAQGIILHTLGTPDDELRRMEQLRADKEVAAALGISRAEAVLLRRVNDSGPGMPQAVLDLSDAGIGSVIGNEWRLLVSFWRHLDTLDEAGWRAAGDAAGAAARAAAGDAAWDEARAAAGDAAWDAAWDAARAAAWDAAWDAAGAAARASYEIMGRSKLKSFFFLHAFGFKTPCDIPLNKAVK